MEFTKTFEVRWADLDPNFHMRSTAFSEYAGHVRFSFLNENNFSFQKFQALAFGPVIFSEQTNYFLEVLPNQAITINCQLAGLSDDGRKWRMSHQIFRQDGKEAARITMDGAWIDLTTRKLKAPPQELIDTLKQLDQCSDFAILT